MVVMKMVCIVVNFKKILGKMMRKLLLCYLVNEKNEKKKVKYVRDRLNKRISE